MADDLTTQFNTALTPPEEAAFQKWARSLGPQGNTRDYDLRGAWLANAGRAGNGHFPDTFKKPNHPTFSDESKYSSQALPGGKWTQTPDGAWAFAPSQHVLTQHGADVLQQYFAQQEPGSKLVLPQAQTALDVVNSALKAMPPAQKP
jgi:hypothetical protein